jgi:hypothetical protein
MNDREAFAALVRQVPGWLERPIEELVKIQAVGSVYLDTHRSILRKLKGGQIELAEEDRRARVAEGQAIGRALLDVEARIGELLESAPTHDVSKAGGPGKPPPHARRPDGVTQQRSLTARTIARHPEAVAQVIQEAEDNEDIPTKTAVLNKVKADREKALREKYDRETRDKKAQNTARTTGEALKYLSKLREIVLVLPAEVPSEGWTDESYAEAKAMVEIIMRRLKVWER